VLIFSNVTINIKKLSKGKHKITDDDIKSLKSKKNYQNVLVVQILSLCLHREKDEKV